MRSGYGTFFDKSDEKVLQLLSSNSDAQSLLKERQELIRTLEKSKKLNSKKNSDESNNVTWNAACTLVVSILLGFSSHDIFKNYVSDSTAAAITVTPAALVATIGYLKIAINEYYDNLKAKPTIDEIKKIDERLTEIIKNIGFTPSHGQTFTS